jgi:acyl-CoA synthetase (AMP-forming)/AMP-acid ligase II
VGKALAHTLIKVVKPNGCEAAANEIGEIVLSGPTIMQGYWRRPAETAAAIHDGWLWSGDIGRVDHDGFLRVLGRRADIISSGGAEIYPSEIECVLREHPAIEEAAVIGISKGSSGEEVAACVVPRAGTAPTPAEIASFCLDRLPEHKRPAKILICHALSRNAGGKVRKSKLRDAYGAPV